MRSPYITTRIKIAERIISGLKREIALRESELVELERTLGLMEAELIELEAELDADNNQY